MDSLADPDSRLGATSMHPSHQSRGRETEYVSQYLTFFLRWREPTSLAKLDWGHGRIISLYSPLWMVSFKCKLLWNASIGISHYALTTNLTAYTLNGNSLIKQYPFYFSMKVPPSFTWSSSIRFLVRLRT